MCGGDPTGQWYEETICAEEGYDHLKQSIVSDRACRGRVSLVGVDFSSTLNLDSMNTFARTATTMLYWEMVWDASCLGAVLHATVPPAAMPTACADYAKKIITDDSLPFTSGMCGMTPDGTACICQTQYFWSTQKSGTYHALNGYLTFNDGSRLGYCVKGSKMSIRDPNGPFGPVVENLQLRPLF